QGADPALAALLGRGDPPLRRTARRLTDRRPRPRHRGRLVPALLAHPAARPVHLCVLANRYGPRDRRRRDPSRACDHEPLPPPAALQLLAEGALPQLRGLGAPAPAPRLARGARA